MIGLTSSLHNDLKRGNQLEAPWLSGAVAALGEEVGVPTPVNCTVAAILAPRADGSLG
jgi:2-dehydropantoate 2-reductase